MRRSSLLVLALTACLTHLVWAETPIENRVSRLERILRQQGPSQILLQLQQLQQEVQELRGLVERNEFMLDQLAQQMTETAGRLSALDDSLETETASAAPFAQDHSPGSPGKGGGANDAGNGGGVIDAPNQSGKDTDPYARQSSPSVMLPKPETAGTDEREVYRSAFGLLKVRRYEEAIAELKAMLKSHPNGQYTDDALFWLGETYYVIRDFEAAATQYDRLIANHPKSPRLPSAMLKLGYIYEQLGDSAAARTAFDALQRRFPETTEARLANDRIEARPN